MYEFQIWCITRFVRPEGVVAIHAKDAPFKREGGARPNEEADRVLSFENLFTARPECSELRRVQANMSI